MSKESSRLSTLIMFQINTLFLNCTQTPLRLISTHPERRPLKPHIHAVFQIWWRTLTRRPRMRPTRPKLSSSSAFTGEPTLVWTMRDTRSFPVCLEKWTVNRFSTWERWTRQQLQTALCKMCNIRTKSLTDVRVESLCFLVFSRKALENHPEASAVCFSTRPIVSCCLVCPVRSERLSPLWCFGLSLFVCLPPFPSVLLNLHFCGLAPTTLSGINLCYCQRNMLNTIFSKNS